jgi:hypothetical protein
MKRCRANLREHVSQHHVVILIVFDEKHSEIAFFHPGFPPFESRGLYQGVPAGVLRTSYD